MRWETSMRCERICTGILSPRGAISLSRGNYVGLRICLARPFSGSRLGWFEAR